MKNISEYGALGMVAIALVVVSVLALRGNEPAAGALMSVLAGGVSYFLRGKVERQA